MEWYVPRSAANAKINLALHVTGQRDDGYHLLDGLTVFAIYGDEVNIAPAKADAFVVNGPYSADLQSTGESGNLVIRARDELRAVVRAGGGEAPPVSIYLVKNIPVASGMAGGSADAATTLRLLRQMWDADACVDAAELDRIALSLGADLPMCLTGPQPLHISGIGDIVEPVVNMPRLSVVLANPGVPVSTPEVFKALQSRENSPLPAIAGDDRQGPYPTDRGSIVDWLRQQTRNDLQETAIGIEPSIRMCLEALDEAGASLARMTGSGATCFGIFEGSQSAAKARQTVASKYPNWFCIDTQTLGSFPNRYGDVGKWID